MKKKKIDHENIYALLIEDNPEEAMEKGLQMKHFTKLFRMMDVIKYQQ